MVDDINRTLDAVVLPDSVGFGWSSDWPASAHEYRAMKQQQVAALQASNDRLRAAVRGRDTVIAELCAAITAALAWWSTSDNAEGWKHAVDGMKLALRRAREEQVT
jgi:hypothetical protein